MIQWVCPKVGPTRKLHPFNHLCMFDLAFTQAALLLSLSCHKNCVFMYVISCYLIFLSYVMLCYLVFCHVELCYVVLSYVMLWNVIL